MPQLEGGLKDFGSIWTSLRKPYNFHKKGITYMYLGAVHLILSSLSNLSNFDEGAATHKDQELTLD